MIDGGGVAVTEADWAAAQSRMRRTSYQSFVVVLVVVPSLSVLAMLLAELTVTGDTRYAVALGFAVLLLMPFDFAVFRANTVQQAKSDRLVGTLTAQLARAVDVANAETGLQDVLARRQRFESRLGNALDMAEGEPEVIDVIERSLALTLPASPVELLLADNSHAHLLRMASASPSGVAPGCPVDSPDRCPAARRAQVQVFTDSEDLDACPKLRGRPDGAVSAVCVPVSIMGRTVGVIHAADTPGTAFAENTVQDLGTLAKLAGTRIGLLRVMAETQLQASTDSLTGLLNRRSFEQRVSSLRREVTSLSVAMADLDRFKELNDTYGHETGDRALRLFAQVVTGSVRAQDLICRHGGEEFVIALGGCTSEAARTILNSVRARLDAAITVAGLPTFTVSFGVVQAGDQEDLPSLIGRADAALFEAKRQGRDRVVVHDALAHPVPAPSNPRDSVGNDLRAGPGEAPGTGEQPTAPDPIRG